MHRIKVLAGARTLFNITSVPTNAAALVRLRQFNGTQPGGPGRAPLALCAAAFPEHVSAERVPRPSPLTKQHDATNATTALLLLHLSSS